MSLQRKIQRAMQRRGGFFAAVKGRAKTYTPHPEKEAMRPRNRSEVRSVFKRLWKAVSR